MSIDEYAALNGLTLEEARAVWDEEDRCKREADFYDGYEEYEEPYNGLTVAERNR